MEKCINGASILMEKCINGASILMEKCINGASIAGKSVRNPIYSLEKV